MLSCDTFTNLPPTDLLTFHESHNSSATAVFFDKSMHKEPVDPKAKDTKKKAEEQSDNDLYVAYEKSSCKLLFLKTAIEVHESLDVRTSLLWRYVARLRFGLARADCGLGILEPTFQPRCMTRIFIFLKDGWLISFVRMRRFLV